MLEVNKLLQFKHTQKQEVNKILTLYKHKLLVSSAELIILPSSVPSPH